MLRKLTYIVECADDGKKVSDILKQRFGVSGMLINRIKKTENGLLINGKSVYAIDIAHTGDVIDAILEEEGRASEMVVATEGELDVLFENEDILVVNKPANCAVHPSHGHFSTSLGNIVMWYYKQKGESFVFRPINRLDRGVSGVMAIAKNAYSHTFASRLLHSGSFYREYLAVVEGQPAEKKGEIKAAIGRRDGSVIEREVCPDGDYAETSYEVISSNGKRSLVRVVPKTGRTHQIRVHMAYIGHPLVGDFLYGSEHPLLPGRLALHSHRLYMELPFNAGEIDIEAPLPEDLRKVYEEKAD